MKMKINNTQNICLEFSNAGGESIFPTAPQLLKSTFSQKIENNLIINTESRLVLLGATGGVASEVVPLSDNLENKPNSISISTGYSILNGLIRDEYSPSLGDFIEDTSPISLISDDTKLTGKTPEDTDKIA